MASWMAAARNVSPAAMMTVSPWSESRWPILPIVVVFPGRSAPTDDPALGIRQTALRIAERVDGSVAIFSWKVMPAAREWVEKVQYELTDGERNRSLEESKKVFSDFFAKAQEAAESGDLHAAITYSRKLLDNEYARENSFIPTITKNIELWESSINDLLKREINQAEAMWQGGDFVQARKLLADLRQKYPDNQDLEKRFNEYDGLLLDKANGFYRNGRLKEEFLNDYEAAKQDYREALKLLEPTAELYKKALAHIGHL